MSYTSFERPHRLLNGACRGAELAQTVTNMVQGRALGLFQLLQQINYVVVKPKIDRAGQKGMRRDGRGRDGALFYRFPSCPSSQNIVSTT
mmetsp:Transcript_14845/g.29664  ORF Transcript_14845/g.29664 Transcript_14845/m.29664 type:complete len:90 (-) Transcript_14845:19-288(-)